MLSQNGESKEWGSRGLFFCLIPPSLSSFLNGGNKLPSALADGRNGGYAFRALALNKSKVLG